MTLPVASSRPRPGWLLSGLVSVFAGLLLIVSAALAFVVVAFNFEIRPVLTGSMRPAYGPGAILITRPVPVSHLHKGMVILFIPPGEHVEFAHRIASVSGSPSDPEGDANRASDPWHARLKSGTVPEVVATVPWVGRIMVGVRGPLQLVLIILGGLVVSVNGTRWILHPRSSTRTPAIRLIHR